MEKNAKSLVDHWTWAADKGLMNRNTAAGLRSACARVLEVLGDGWEQTDITDLNVDDILLRFQNLKKKDFVPQVLEAYKHRFRKAITSYFEYLGNPGGWKPGAQEKPSASQREHTSRQRRHATASVTVERKTDVLDADHVEYPFPLRPGVMARLVLPCNLTKSDVARLSAFMSMLVMSADRRQTSEEGTDVR